MKEMDKITLEQCDTSALLSMLVYLNLEECEQCDLKTILERDSLWVGQEDCRKILSDAIQNDEGIGDIKVIHESRSNGFDDKLVIAATFEDPKTNNVYVTYRGTGDGKWVDNAVGLAEKDSQMQREACKYYDAVIADMEDVTKGKLFVTGHSKGGNSAQYVVINSKNGYLIDRMYSIDGQGFSHEGCQDCYAYQLDPEYYESQRQKMYSINGQNDYVHDLGISIIPEDQTYFVRTSEAAGAGDFHAISFMFSGGKLDWYDENGQHDMSIEQGPIGEFAKLVSKHVMEMDPEDRRDCAMSIMALLEAVMPYDGVLGGEYRVGSGEVKTASLEEQIGLLGHGAPLLLDLLQTKKGQALIKELASIRLKKTYEEKGWSGVLGDVVAGLGIAVAMEAFGRDTIETLSEALKIVGAIEDFVEGLNAFESKIKKHILELGRETATILRKAGAWANENLNPGMRYSNENSYIKVDVDVLRSCADRLTRVNDRMKTLDKRLDTLYWRVGLLGLWNLMQADLLTGYSWRVSRCISYLNETAADFERAESNIRSKM